MNTAGTGMKFREYHQGIRIRAFSDSMIYDFCPHPQTASLMIWTENSSNVPQNRHSMSKRLGLVATMLLVMASCQLYRHMNRVLLSGMETILLNRYTIPA